MNRMRCAEVDVLADRYVDGALDAGVAATLEAHLASCARCRASVEGAQRLAAVLEGGDRVKAPRGFTASVMDEVYKEALWGRKEAAAAEASRPAGAMPARMRRRLGLSFVLSAGVLCAVLLAQPRLLPGLAAVQGAPFTREASGVVRSALSGADRAVERALQSAGAPAAGLVKGDGQ